MKSTNSSLKLSLIITLSLVAAGCATKQERDVSLPSWVDIYDRYDDEGKKVEKKEKESAKKESDEAFNPESSADASDRLASKEKASTEKPAKPAAEDKKEKSGSFFDFLFGKKEPEEKAPELAKDDSAKATKDVSTKAEAKPEEAKTKKELVKDTTDKPSDSKPKVEKPPVATTTPDKKISPDKPKAKPVVPPKPVIPKPKALTAQNEKHGIEAKKASTDYQNALAKLKAGELQSALILFQELSNRYPTLSGPIVNQAIILRKQGNLNQAKAVLQKAILNKTQNPYLMNEMGLVNRELGKFAAAKQSYLSAIRIEPNYDKAHYNLAVLADLYLHDPVLAYKEFQAFQALQETPNKKVAGWLKEIKRRIK